MDLPRIRASLLLTSLLLAAACPGSGAEQRPTLLGGEPESSAPVRSSAARPRPGAEPEENPLEGDRLALDEAMVRARRVHTEAHAEAALALEDFSHPACASLARAERRTCPLSSIRWTVLRDVEGGLEIETPDPKVEPTRLRWQLLCHMAFARSQSSSQTCPLATPGLAVTVLKVGQRAAVRLVVPEPARVSGLRRQLRLLIRGR